MIAVIGATGNTGRAAVRELKTLGESPLCVVRNADKAREVLGADAKIAIAELSDRPALQKVLAGIKNVFIVTGHNPQSDEQQINILEAAKAAGVEVVVKGSGGRAVVTPDSESIVGRGHLKVEEAMKSSGLKWTILRPGLFMQNTLLQAPLIKNESKMVLAFPKDVPIAFIDTRDSGAFGARVVRDPARHAGKTYEYTGVRSSFGEFANSFSEVLGRPITYVQLSLEQAEQGMKSRGMPDWLVSHQIAIARIAAAGGFSSENVQPFVDVVGRQPIALKQFVADHKGVFV
jgi:uncharacterized protein YbjT (DUF2867 family)